MSMKKITYNFCKQYFNLNLNQRNTTIRTIMSVALIKKSLNISIAISRHFSCTSVVCMKKWRVNNGLPANRTAEGVLTDTPDYTFLDGRPTPLLVKQKKRLEQQRAIASRIVELCSEVDFAKERQKKILQEEEEERQKILANRLKPKGQNLSLKK